MTKEEKDKLFKLLSENRNVFAASCNRKIAEECGKITGADYMLQKLIDILRVESEVEEE